jgi:ATP-dependent Clp protease ATP-binding subunit ClpA
MFERFGKEARGIVTTAVAEAEARGDSRVGTEHLLIAVAGVGFPFQRSLLGPLDVGSEEIRRQLDRLDSESLAAVGVDLELFDPALRALDGAVPPHARRHLPFTHSAKSVLTATLRETIKQGGRQIGTEHVLLALLSLPAGDPVGRVFSNLGADPLEIRTDIEEALRRAS